VASIRRLSERSRSASSFEEEGTPASLELWVLWPDSEIRTEDVAADGTAGAACNGSVVECLRTPGADPRAKLPLLGASRKLADGAMPSFQEVWCLDNTGQHSLAPAFQGGSRSCLAAARPRRD
jgi:hypothetical protein